MNFAKFEWAKARTNWDWLWLAFLGLLVQGFWAARLQQPTYVDAYYYATNGQRLAAGDGFTELIIWQYLDQPAGLPAPSHTYWMPLASILAAAGYLLVDNFRGAQIPFWLLAGTLPVLSYVISRELGGERWQRVTAALLTAAGGYYAGYWNQPATFAPFAWAAGLCLLALAWGSRKGAAAYWLLAGLMAGLAHLTRADGLLLLLIGLLFWWLELRRPLSGPPLQRPLRALGHLVGGYLLIMGAWQLRNWLALGQPLPATGVQTLFLTTYDDLFAFGRRLSLAGFLEWGWANIARSKLEALSLAGQSFVAVTGLIFLAPFIVGSWLILAKRAATSSFLRPLTWYTLALFTAMTLFFTFPGARGGLFHSSAALWPWSMALAVAGIGLAVDWVAARRARWRPAQAKRFFAAGSVIIAYSLTVALSWQRLTNNAEAAAYRQIGAVLPRDAMVLVGNAPGFYYHTQLAAASIPNEPVAILLQAAARYEATHLVLDKDLPQPLAVLYSASPQNPQIRLIGDYGDFKLFELATSSVGATSGLPSETGELFDE